MNKKYIVPTAAICLTVLLSLLSWSMTRESEPESYAASEAHDYQGGLVTDENGYQIYDPSMMQGQPQAKTGSYVQAWVRGFVVMLFSACILFWIRSVKANT